MSRSVTRAEVQSQSLLEIFIHGLEDGNLLDVQTVMERHTAFMNEFYEYADEKGWEYTERSPVVEMWRGNEESVDLEDVEDFDMEAEPVMESPDSDDLTSYGWTESDYRSEWSPDIEEDEMGSVESINLIYQSDSPYREDSEAIGAEIELLDEVGEGLESDLVEIMEQHYGTREDFPNYHTVNGAIV